MDIVHKPNNLYLYVLLAIVLGSLPGYFFPTQAVELKFLSDLFIKMVKMMISPIIFCTIVSGICSVNNIKRVGQVGIKAIVYFEILSTFALLLGYLVVKILKPGAGLNIKISELTGGIPAETLSRQKSEVGWQHFINSIIPESFFSAFSSNEILQVLFVSVLFGIALLSVKEKGAPILKVIQLLSPIFFYIIQVIMKLAPLGAFGAMAYTVGKYGYSSIHSLLKLMGCLYVTCFFFVLVVLGLILFSMKYNIFRFLKFIKEEIFVVIGTSSSEAALPSMMKKMEALGCHPSVVGLVIPTGYSFNLDGTSIYLTMAVIFLAQATNTPLTFYEEMLLIGVLMLTSKGAAAVTGGGFVTLAATLASVDTIPAVAISLLLGIDRFMSEARAVTNLIGNGVATVVVSKWEKEIHEEIAKDKIGI